jgi:Tol biopolymer transport system component
VTRIYAPPSAARQARVPLLLGVLVVIIALLGASWVLMGGSAAPTGQEVTLEYTTERGQNATAGTADSRLRATLRLPWSDGSPETALASVNFQLVDGSGNPALVGPGPAQPEAMRPALEISVWYYDGSMPSAPGTYHARVQAFLLDGTSRSYELSDPELEVLAETGAQLASGFVFARDSNLWVVSTDLQRERRLTFYPSYYEYAASPAWSPDGKSIAYTYSPRVAADQLPSTDIWAIPASGPPGAGARKMALHGENELLNNPAWSPDGKYLYFTVQSTPPITSSDAPAGGSTQTWRIDRVDLGTESRSQVVEHAQMPSFSSDGKQMVYVETTPLQAGDFAAINRQRLVLVDMATSKQTVLVNDSAHQMLYAPRISPDGKWVVYAAINAPVQSEVPADGPSSYSDFGASTVLDWLLFKPRTASAHGLPWDLYLCPATGGQEIRLTNLGEDEPYPIWLDKSTIAFMATTGMYKLGIDDHGQPAGQPSKEHPGAPYGGLTWHGP